MTYVRLHTLHRLSARFAKDDAGGTLVEFTLVLPLFLLLFFGLIDFGRLAFHYVVAEKAMHVATRVATVRPVACNAVNLPEFHLRPEDGGGGQNFGTRCNAAGNVCRPVADVSCPGALQNPTVAEIWPLIRGALPVGATPENLRFSYSYDPNLGFLGGPYVPVVTVELQNLSFQFVSPLSAFVALGGGTAVAGLGADIPYPPMSVSLPGEDLNQGEQG
ncbi:TadE/TadG family type IV pilus assembly protein [Marimonas sp. MJW-29]|uniref:TadE/TadG family type IV pilus assembly protein n=1 Tax=Sulfitobacter sediminis TaxID=3234186 RepID=A0ABV3RTE3_9RHOB